MDKLFKMKSYLITLLLFGILILIAQMMIFPPLQSSGSVTIGKNPTVIAIATVTPFRLYLPFIINVPTPINDPIAYYPFEGNAQDVTGHNNDGQEYNGVTYVNGKIGQAAHFDGLDDYIIIIPHSDVSHIADFTISVWVYLENWKHQANSNKDRQYIFDGHSHPNVINTDYYRPGFGLIYDGPALDSLDGQAEEIHNFIHYYDDIYLEQNTPMPLKGGWHFMVFTRNGKYDYTYFDGQLVASTYANNTKSDLPLNMKHAWFIGTFAGNTPYYGDGKFNYSFYGLIDDLSIYQRALSATEIEFIYNQEN